MTIQRKKEPYVNRQFPDDFLWGAAASAPQTEGRSFIPGGADNVWDYWHQSEPGRFHEAHGPDVTSSFRLHYKEDIQRMKALHFNSYRTSISWSSFLPDGTTVNEEAVAFYRDVFTTMIDAGIEPIVNLYHFDLPVHFHEQGGWESRETVRQFVNYARKAFGCFGDLVNKWTTFNEPMVPVEMGYFHHYHLPAVVDGKRGVLAGFHTMLASAGAVQVFREEMGNQGEIGIILNLTPSYPKDESREHVDAANRCDLVFNRSFLDPSVRGTYPPELVEMIEEAGWMPNVSDEDLTRIHTYTVDFLGVNYYKPRRVQQPSDHALEQGGPFARWFEEYDMPGKKMNPYRGWEIYEKGLYDISRIIKEDYGNIPWYVAENGMGVADETRFEDTEGIISDTYRIAFISDHLRWLHKGIEEGSNCFGYHVWTFVDNWSWLNAYKNRYGFYRLDTKTQERTVKLSGLWFAEVAKNNGFQDQGDEH